MVLATVVLLGGVSLWRLKLEFPPRVEMPFIGVMVPYPNGSPARPSGRWRPSRRSSPRSAACARSTATRSSTRPRVGVQFDWGRDVNLLRLEAKEKIDQIRGELPAGRPPDPALDLQHQRHPDHRGAAHLRQGARPVRELEPAGPEDHRAAAAHPRRGAREHRRDPAHPGLGVPRLRPRARARRGRHAAVPGAGVGQRGADRRHGHRAGDALRRAHRQRHPRRGGRSASCRSTSAGCACRTWRTSSTARRR